MTNRPHHITFVPYRENLPVRQPSVGMDVLEIVAIGLLAFVLAVDAWLMMAML